MLIQTKLTQADFINVNFVLLYQKLLIKILTVIGLLAALFVASDKILGLGFTSQEPSNYVFPLVILVGLPIITFLSAKKNYAATKRIQETIEYKFTNEYLEIKGESFNSQLGWNKFYKVTKTKKWVFIWQNNSAANIISRKDIWDSQIEELKEILESHKVKNNL
jgi:hypothetical protein